MLLFPTMYLMCMAKLNIPFSTANHLGHWSSQCFVIFFDTSGVNLRYIDPCLEPCFLFLSAPVPLPGYVLVGHLLIACVTGPQTWQNCVYQGWPMPSHIRAQTAPQSQYLGHRGDLKPWVSPRTFWSSWNVPGSGCRFPLAWSLPGTHSVPWGWGVQVADHVFLVGQTLPNQDM